MAWTTTCGPISSARKATRAGNLQRINGLQSNFEHHDVDIRSRPAVLELLQTAKPPATVHTTSDESGVARGESLPQRPV